MQMSKPDPRWAAMRMTEVGAASTDGAIAVLPVGATEQHGPHLATGTDTLLAEREHLNAAREELKGRFDVLISDIGMPDADGYELIRRIRELPDGRNVPAAALTALARSEDRMRALTAGFQTHLAKPIAPGELVAVVRSLAALRR